MKTFTALLFLILAASVARAEQQPSFQLNATARRKLVENAVTLKVGDSFQTVTNALGTPTFDQPVFDKDNPDIVGRDLKFYAVIWQHEPANETRDELVDVKLDKTGHVRSVYIKVTLN